MVDILGNDISVIQIVSTILLLIGIVVIFRSLIWIRRIYGEVKNKQKQRLWRIINTLLYFFLLGYGIALFLIFLDNKRWIELLLGFIFALGAIYVALMFRISYETLKDLNSRKDRYSHLISEVNDYAIVLLDSKGFVWSWNQGAEQIKGYTMEEALWLDFRNFYTPEDRKAGKPELILAEARVNGKARDEGWRVKKDGTRFWAVVSITASKDEDGNVVSYSKVTRDLTERKLAEDRQKKNLELIKLKNKELEQFTYIASHDLQEPLSTLRGLVDILLEDDAKDLDDESKQVLGFIEDTTQRMTQLVKGLLDYGRIGGDKEFVTVDLNALVKNVLSDLGASIQKNDAKVLVGNLPVLMGLEVELRLLFQNLLGNAIKFRHPDRSPEVFIGVIEYENEYKFTISDNGIGFSKDATDKIFVIFQRLHEREEYEGTGIGLAHCRKIVDLHGGKIWATSEPGKGSIFNFTIPKHKGIDARDI